jgi:3-oxoacyl-[acyl-carrier protein] reductase
MFPESLKGKVAWVTGASKGIGKAIALELARAGADVVISNRTRSEAALGVAAEIESLGRRAIVLPCDVSDQTACEEVVAVAEKEMGPIAILVNCAGVVADNLFMMLEGADWAKVLNANLMGTVNCSRAVIRGMMGKRWGRIINIGSAAGQKSGRGQANYAASKAAVEAVTRSLAVELGSRNITVNCLAPGVIETDMSAEVRKLGAEEIMSRQVIKRFGKVEDVAPWAVMLASEYGAFITGQTILIDGGLKLP